MASQRNVPIVAEFGQSYATQSNDDYGIRSNGFLSTTTPDGSTGRQLDGVQLQVVFGAATSVGVASGSRLR
jgi:hypothetical protein